MDVFDNVFGWFAKSAEDTKATEEHNNLKIIAPEENDGSKVTIVGENGSLFGSSMAWSTSFDVDASVLNEAELITRYREMSFTTEIDKAIEIIVNEFISIDGDHVVEINLDNLEYSEKFKETIITEFDYILKLLNFNTTAFEIIRRWYIDGRLQYQVVVDKKKYREEGIAKLVYLDPRKIKKNNVIKKVRSENAGTYFYVEKDVFYIYSENGFTDTNNLSSSVSGNAIKITNDAVVQVTSGLLDPTNSVVLSYLHKAMRPLTQLKALEDATMIYRLSRAPERRIFYIDVGNLPKPKAEQHIRDQMNTYKSKITYDSKTGSVKSDSKQLIMTEDFFIGRRSDGKATEITTLPGGNLSGELSEVDHFKDKLYNSLNVPTTRMNPETGFTFGKSTEITRDEVALTKFVFRLRKRFSQIFLDLLKRQLSLKNIMDPDEFEDIQGQINFTFSSDNHFDELLESEIRETRLNMLDRVINYAPGGQFNTFFSKEYIYKEILHMTDEEIKEMQEQIDEEKKDLEPEDMQGQAGPRVSDVVYQKSQPNINVDPNQQQLPPDDQNNQQNQDANTQEQ